MPVKVRFPNEILALVKTWIENAGLDDNGGGTATEIAWLGIARLVSSSCVRVERVWLPAVQKVGAAHGDIDAEEVSALYERVFADGCDPADLNMEGHSHAALAAHRSSEDSKSLLKHFGAKDWCVGITHNLKGEIAGELYVNKPVFVRITDLEFVEERVAYPWEAEQAAAARAATKRATISLLDGVRSFNFDGEDTTRPFVGSLSRTGEIAGGGGGGTSADDFTSVKGMTRVEVVDELEAFEGQQTTVGGLIYEVTNGKLWRWAGEPRGTSGSWVQVRKFKLMRRVLQAYLQEWEESCA